MKTNSHTKMNTCIINEKQWTQYARCALERGWTAPGQLGLRTAAWYKLQSARSYGMQGFSRLVLQRRKFQAVVCSLTWQTTFCLYIFHSSKGYQGNDEDKAYR